MARGVGVRGDAGLGNILVTPLVLRRRINTGKEKTFGAARCVCVAGRSASQADNRVKGACCRAGRRVDGGKGEAEVVVIVVMVVTVAVVVIVVTGDSGNNGCFWWWW